MLSMSVNVSFVYAHSCAMLCISHNFNFTRLFAKSNSIAFYLAVFKLQSFATNGLSAALLHFIYKVQFGLDKWGCA